MKLRFLSFILVFTLLLVGCSTVSNSNSQKPLDNQKPVIYASIYPMYDFANKVGKEKIDLRLMVPPGIEPHDWEPSAKLMAQLEEADAIIYNGANMEQWIDKVLASIEGDMKIVETSKEVELLPFKGHNHDGHEDNQDNHGNDDPHVWLDPIRAKKQAEVIKNTLGAVDPDNKDFYEANYEEFALKLDELDEKYKMGLKDIKRREIIVSHSSFGYLSDRYDLEQISIMGISPQEEPSAAKLAELTKEVKKHGITTVFFETLTNPKLSQVLAEEVGARTDVLHPIGGITLEESEEGKEYLGLMEENLKALVKALEE